MKDWNWKHVGIGAVILALALGWPPTRAIIKFILPLGGGIDDLIFWIALVIALLVWEGRWYKAWKIREDVAFVNRRGGKIQQIVITALVVMVALFVPYTGEPIQRYFLMGQNLFTPGTFIALGAEALIILAVWAIASLPTKKGK